MPIPPGGQDPAALPVGYRRGGTVHWIPGRRSTSPTVGRLGSAYRRGGAARWIPGGRSTPPTMVRLGKAYRRGGAARWIPGGRDPAAPVGIPEGRGGSLDTGGGGSISAYGGIPEGRDGPLDTGGEEDASHCGPLSEPWPEGRNVDSGSFCDWLRSQPEYKGQLVLHKNTPAREAR